MDCNATHNKSEEPINYPVGNIHTHLNLEIK